MKRSGKVKTTRLFGMSLPFYTLHPVLPTLPPELQCKIFEITASFSPKYALCLMLVARKVKEWIEPFLYHSIVFSRSFENYPPIYKGRDQWKATRAPLFDKATPHARHVLIESSRLDKSAEILQHAPNVESLALWSLPLIIESQRPLLPIIQSLTKLTRISASPYQLMKTKGVSFVFDHAAFVNLTHFGILCMEEDICEWAAWAELALLPKLTHLSVDYSNPNFVEDVLSGCTGLKLFVVFYEDRRKVLDRAAEREEEGVRHPRHPDVGVMLDKRVVQIPEIHDHWVEEWERNVRGQESFWKRAERIQRMRV
ncbi:hypothetical protein CPB84DRAFT_1780541 [Gymnopilus junonius]|uniref:Uncharacterized protein n=1 Tax=Gymnopilus junonius TaxID=109634 RepID=A0A9P5TMV4_GYMJU|nr:hypothetical protein CPB84DRAFT_1780541 [Gymnopilus junonius]